MPLTDAQVEALALLPGMNRKLDDWATSISLIGGVSTLDPYWNTNHTFTLFGGSSNVSGVFSGFTGDYTFTTENGGTGLFSYTDGSLDLTYIYSVPEPQTWALAALGLSAVIFRLRRNKRID